MDNNPSTGSGHGSNFFSGFLLGALVGAGIVFLFGTKKGKKLLKAISEDGIDSISDILDKTNKSVDLDEVVEEEKEVAPKKEIGSKEKTVEEKPKTRRFFKGISRHLN